MDRKQEIVEMTIELIQTMGYGNLSFKDLSDRLGIAKASIHHHFAKKEDLGLAVCNQMVEIMTGVTAKFDECGNSSFGKLEMFFSMLATQWDNCQKTCPIGSLQNDFYKLSEDMKICLQKVEDIQLDFFTKILTEGRELKEISFQGPAADQALIIAFSLKGAIQSARLRGSDIIIRSFAQLKLSLQPLPSASKIN
ncbi:MAG: TetR/AcrR family transcriptional regulator [SAR324 cluster bacterium]|nr:TetR/AcrR family transcriptional regulator [SAR324 cluster bacterium]